MKKCVLTFFVFLGHVLNAGEIQIERVTYPNFSWYEPLFFKFCDNVGRVPCDQQRCDQILQEAFLKEAKSYAYSVDNRIFLQATVADEIVGYLSCHIHTDNKILISQMAFDPVKYDSVLVKELLFVLFQIMPNVKLISVVCPAFCPDLINLFQELGFAQVNTTVLSDWTDLFVEYELQVHPKCAMCKILYGPDFWEQDIEDESDWGVCQLDENGDPCSESSEESLIL